MDYFDEFVREILSLKNSKEAVDFLKGILTPQELEQLPLRLQIVKKLKKGISQRKVAEDLGVGVATVTRGSREIRKGRFKYIRE